MSLRSALALAVLLAGCSSKAEQNTPQAGFHSPWADPEDRLEILEPRPNGYVSLRAKERLADQTISAHHALDSLWSALRTLGKKNPPPRYEHWCQGKNEIWQRPSWILTYYPDTRVRFSKWDMSPDATSRIQTQDGLQNFFLLVDTFPDSSLAKHYFQGNGEYWLITDGNRELSIIRF